MDSISEHWHLTLQRTIMSHPENTLETSVELWEQLAHPLLPLIGTPNFELLFSRSLHVTRHVYPWIMPCRTARGTRLAYADLRTCLSGDGVEETPLASISLLDTFIDILVLLVGEQITEHVLDLAWTEHKAPAVQYCPAFQSRAGQ